MEFDTARRRVFSAINLHADSKNTACRPTASNRTRWTRYLVRFPMPHVECGLFEIVRRLLWQRVLHASQQPMLDHASQNSKRNIDIYEVRKKKNSTVAVVLSVKNKFKISAIFSPWQIQHTVIPIFCFGSRVSVLHHTLIKSWSTGWPKM